MKRPSYHSKYNNWDIDKADYVGCADLSRIIGEMSHFDNSKDILITQLRRTNLGANKRAIITYKHWSKKFIVEVALKTTNNKVWSDTLETAKSVCDMYDKKIEKFMCEKLDGMK